MGINEIIGVLAIIFVLLLVIFLVRRNRKDQEEFERQMNESEIKPEKHKGDHV
ncbi:hypothetical protein [Pedobacter gandavensis]|uniref:hypothetical protein n=1 Tax=Pedobacter gandavensis TaxID=2679963 RepID=UPI00292CCFBA|nr:hypothetical protein [Pedobacter gandavensis]